MSSVAAGETEIVFRQTNAEAEMIGLIHEARQDAGGIVINPAAFSYSGYAMLDALKACDCPIVEVHISNIHARDEIWRAKSIVSAAATGVVTGLGVEGYALAVRWIAELADRA